MSLRGSDKQVTLVMPIFNTLSRRDTFGRPLIDRMMESIAHQELKPTQVLILDNQSDDGTVDHLTALADGKLCVNVAIDEERRPPEEAINILMRQVETPYVAVVNDDDAIRPSYLASLFSEIEASGSALAYANGKWLGLDGAVEGALVIGRSRRYGAMRSGASNFQRYLRMRNPVPMLFGLWKTPAAQSVFAVNRVDEHSHDLDNMIMATTLGRGYRVSFINQQLFLYSVRAGHRAPPARDPSSRQGGRAFFHLLAGNWSHHLRFSTTLLGRIAPSFAPANSTVDPLEVAAIVSCELRYRLEMGVTWALALTSATKSDFDELRGPRRALTASRLPLGNAGSSRSKGRGGSRSRLLEEIDRWQQFLYRCSPPSGQSSPWCQERIDIVGEVVDFIEALRRSGS